MESVEGDVNSEATGKSEGDTTTEDNINLCLIIHYLGLIMDTIKSDCGNMYLEEENDHEVVL